MKLKRNILGLSVSFALMVPAIGMANAEPAGGSLFRAATNNELDKYDITVAGWAGVTALYASDKTDDGNISNGAFLNQEDGIGLDQIGLMLCKGMGCLPTSSFAPAQNVLSRVGPFPGPLGEVQVGFNVTAMYGQDIQFFRVAGIDDYTFDQDDENKFAVPQFYIDAYIPAFDGMTLMLGSFFTFIGNEIGAPFTPPNWFSTLTYAAQHGPSKHVGALASIKVPTSEDFGLLSFDAGLVAGWNNWDEKRPTLIGAARWRSPDLATWLDVEFIYGDGEGDAFGAAKGGSPYIAVSSTGDTLNRFHSSTTLTHALNPDLQLAAEFIYGFQEAGDVSAAPVFITEDSGWMGLNVAARYKLDDNLHMGVRAEWFDDENAANVLWSSVGATGGDVYSLTANLSWSANQYIKISPELRYDTYKGQGAGLFAGGKSDDQFIALLNAVTYF
ncbi:MULTISPECIES: outer membrane beta-barrel protein [Enterovibrio]|uniref:Outer membrane beta-barrel protein n=2 Tax=Enterovibrio norvegicus TaxID=188144 RepID=A0ABV4L685_9GAMM|nr:outer membrane beta-barrel protein [Enterovibrio norvegicus]MCC4796731.1 porin [Enterovibrio norvegicus]SFP93941.1 Putative beta-barrel porin-2, OmpL-like. bbp2 [Enterovibrio norvegicus DSM 15893]